MRGNRMFVPQRALDQWVSEGRVELEGDVMKMGDDGTRFRLRSALRFLRTVAGEDTHGLVGKVKDLDQVAALGGDHYSSSVVLGDSAFDVVEGHTGQPMVETLAACPDEKPSDVDLLARFLLAPAPTLKVGP